jgi:KaiC/GvpD/RAD55 family RecA-like ATPase
MMTEFVQRSPLRILEKSPQKGLGRGNLGALVARAGVGKTACLIHIAFDKIFRDMKIVHVSLQDGPDKVSSYYNVIFSELVKALGIKNERETRTIMEKNRMILAYLNQSFDLPRLRENLKNLAEKTDFKADALVVDGLDFSNAGTETFENFRILAREYETEIWFSALSHRHIAEVNERGIPYPCHEVDGFFSIILQLQPTPQGIQMKLLKNHEMNVNPEDVVMLDPSTFLTAAL